MGKDIRCPHCKFIENTFGDVLKQDDATNREYWLMTQVFVYLHRDNEYPDECSGIIKITDE